MFRSGYTTICLAVLFALGTRAAEPGVSPVVPAPQPGMEARHLAKVAEAKAGNHDLLLIGDSITHNLENPDYKAVWNQFFAPRHAFDLGYSGARTENILWNLQHGELEGQTPKVIVLLIGTNDTDDANFPVVHTAQQVADGTAAIVSLLRERCPEAKILLLRIFPRTNVYKNPDGTERGSATKRFDANLLAGELVAKLADEKTIFFLDVNHAFIKLDGNLDPLLMPDLLHPSPAGAQAWAVAMEPTLSALMGGPPLEPEPKNSAIIPVSKLENDGYDWWKRHDEILKLDDSYDPNIVLIGDSITHFWDGQPQSPGIKPRGPLSFEQAFGTKRVLNQGYGWDRTQNVLWRLDHSELDGLRPQWIVLNIGSNNFTATKNARANTPAEITEGILEIILRLRTKTPASKIVLMGVFPFGKDPNIAQRQPVQELNELLRKSFDSIPGIYFLDVNPKLLEPDGSLSVDIMPDGVHPAEKGYAIWGEALSRIIQ